MLFVLLASRGYPSVICVCVSQISTAVPPLFDIYCGFLFKLNVSGDRPFYVIRLSLGKLLLVNLCKWSNGLIPH